MDTLLPIPRKDDTSRSGVAEDQSHTGITLDLHELHAAMRHFGTFTSPIMMLRVEGHPLFIRAECSRFFGRIPHISLLLSFPIHARLPN